MSKVSVLITGFMGSGKTTVALALAKILNCQAIDLDQLITEHTDRTPKEIIEEDGELAFRDIETRLLLDALGQDTTCVIALGGGAWTLETNRNLIAEHSGFVVWLDVPFGLCWKRITAAGHRRPLARNEEQARTLYQERRPLYELATVRTTAAGASADELARLIANRLVRDGLINEVPG